MINLIRYKGGGFFTKLSQQTSSYSVQFSSITQSCSTLCNPMACSLPTSSVHRFSHAQTLEWVAISFSNAWKWKVKVKSLSRVCPQSLPASESFPISQLFASGGQSTGVSALASVLPKSIQDWFPLKLTGWISLLSKGLSRVFSSTIVQRHQFFSARRCDHSHRVKHPGV